ncbi:amino acid ABC transporter substrate-binding protein [Caulobacter sp. D4A]|uniref:amino acid ABC transporter substrate-binding protein n=1 Tax=unclassified Caulobacter TaxID=2648921 RepID=UPI000D72D7A3|nr:MULTISPECIES: amino acid ABC transporter substrate-binding protein [unclassified Caulobacter]PXA91193.1 amino acid ABC transporter substrate-binding protein [Caulobacter sp. D4A]PXA96786.1 amino acid ABC transporter substrate-binding protein [Caulobacter sp. D5]
MKLPDFLNDLVTTRDGVSFDPIRVGMILGGLGVLAFTGWDVVANQAHFNAVEFGTGLAAIFAGGGFGIGAKVKDEPDA